MKPFYKYILTLVTILLTTTPAWAVEQYIEIERFNGTTRFDDANLKKITDGEYTNNVKFSIQNVTYYYYNNLLTDDVYRLDYPTYKDDKQHDSQWNWVVQQNETNPFSVVVTDIKCQVRGKNSQDNKTANAWFNNNAKVDCKTTYDGENGSKEVSISNANGLGNSVTLHTQGYYKKASFSNLVEDYVTFTLHNIRYTYRVTQRMPLFQYRAIAETNNSEYGVAYSSWESFTNATTSISTATAHDPNAFLPADGLAKTVYFKAVAKEGYNFVGWKTSLDATTYESYDEEYAFSFTSTSNNDEEPSTIVLYAIFNAQKDPRFEIASTATLKVGESIPPTFTFADVANLPTEDSNKDFYFVITHNPDATTKAGSPDPNKVVSYTYGTNQLIGLNSGTATITFIHKETADYYADTLECVVTVSKNATSFSLNTLSECYTGDEFALSSLFTTTTNNTEVPFTCTSGNESILKFENNKLIAVCAGKTTFTVEQKENYKWLRHAQTLNITVKKHDSGFQLRQTEHTCKIGDVITEAQLYTLVNNEILPTIESNNRAVVSFNPTTRQLEANNAGEAIITISQPADCKWTDYITTCKVIVEKHTPAFTWEDPVYFNSTVIDYFSTNNTATAITITQPSTDTDVAELYFSKTNANDLHTLDLTTYAKESSTTVTISQEENWYWYAKTETHTITPIDPNNHVTFTINSNNKMNNVFKYSTNNADDLTWDNGIRLGDDDWVLGLGGGDGGYDWSDKYIIIEFTGIPDTLYLTTDTDDAATNGTESDLFFYISEGYMPQGATTPTFTQTWEYTKQNNDVALKLNPNTRFVKLCYTGNLRGWFKGTNKYNGVTVTELNQFEARPDTLDFGTQYVDNPDTTKTFDFHYANAGYKVNLKSTDSLHFTVSPTYIDTIGGEKYGIIKDIQVTYHPTEVHNTVDTDAKILIWDEAGHQDTVFLVANTIKSKPTLYWTKDWSAKEPIVILNQHMPDTVAKSTNGYKVKYRSDNESILKIADDSLSFIAVGIGETYITAHADSDRVYLAPDTIRKLFHVTNKQMQYIVWEDNLTDLCIGDNPIPLTAQVWVMTDAANNTWEYSPEQTAKIQYRSTNTSVVSVNGNILSIHGKGELLLEASVPADSTYEMAKAQVPVRVYDCSIACTDADLVIPIVGMQLEDELHFNPYQIWDNEKIVEIDTSKGIPGNLTFTYRGVKEWNVLEGKIRVFESTDGGNTWNQVLSDADAVTPEDNTTQYSPLIPLSPNATHIKFERFPNDFSSVRYGSHYVQFITVLPAHYIKTVPDDIHFGNVYVGNSIDTTINVLYSSIRSDLQLAVSENHLSIDKTTIIDECGAWDTVPLKVSLRADAQIVGAYHQYVTIKDPLGEITDTVHVFANVVKNNPTVTWNITTDTIRSSAEWETKKTAFASSGAQVFYEVTEGNQMDEYAYLNDNGKMILLRGGTITARAYIKETSVSNEVSKFHDFFIIVDPLFEDTHNDHNWLNDDNWNIGRTPWDTDSATIAANKHVSLDTVIITEGLSFESGGSIHITSTGGLTVGAQGIKGAATDGSSITIDNLKTGAGFLRISPEYTGTMPKTTVRYQTRSTLDTGANKNATWQYIGAPGADCQFTVDYITWLYQWSEPQNWINKTGTLTLEPFAGYAITQYGKPTYELIAEPINTSQTITLTMTPPPSGMEGNNLFANSYMAPIDIKNFTGDEFTGNVEKTFYIFNSGSWNDWNQNDSIGNSIGGNGSNTPGQYCAIPVLSAAHLDDITTIPPMQGVYVIAKENGATIRLNYDKHVWQAGNNTSTNMNEAMRAPHRQQVEEQMQQNDFLRLRIQVNSANSGADRMYIIQDSNTTSDYDNGYDAPNQFAEGMANIYTTESFGKMEVSCSNNIDSMYIGFQAGNDNQYTLTFSSIIGDSIYLKDLSNDTIFQVFEDGQYQFTAQPLSTNDLRFQVLLHPINEEDTNNGNGGVSTDIDNVTSAHIWHSHNHLYISNAPANSTMTLYNINGQLILSTHLQHSTHTIDLGYLQKGVYILQLGHQMYKFVCQ